jgi:hypothetical protein
MEARMSLDRDRGLDRLTLKPKVERTTVVINIKTHFEVTQAGRRVEEAVALERYDLALGLYDANLEDGVPMVNGEETACARWHRKIEGSLPIPRTAGQALVDDYGVEQTLRLFPLLLSLEEYAYQTALHGVPVEFCVSDDIDRHLNTRLKTVAEEAK